MLFGSVGRVCFFYPTGLYTDVSVLIMSFSVTSDPVFDLPGWAG